MCINCIEWFDWCRFHLVCHVTLRLQSSDMVRRLTRQRVPQYLTQMANQHYLCFTVSTSVPSVLWCCWLGGKKGIWPIKTEWFGAGVVVYQKRCWFAKKTVRDKLLASEMHCYWRILRISWTEWKQTVKYVTNSELKRICYKEPFGGNSYSFATCAGWRTTGS